MRYVFYSLLLLFSAVAGCVPLSKYNELKTTNAQLNQEITRLKETRDALNSEIVVLKRKNEAVDQEISRLKNLAQYYFKKGMESYQEENFHDALDYFEKLTDRYPTDPLAEPAGNKIAEIKTLSKTNYNKILKAAEVIKDLKAKIELIDRGMDENFLTGFDFEKLTQRRESLANELKILEEMNAHILTEDDPTQSLRYYRTTHSTLQQVGFDKSFHVELYVIHHYSGKKDLRLRTRYIGNKWISYDTVILRSDNGVQAEVFCKYPEKLSSMNDDRIYEWSDNDIDDDKVVKMAKAHSISVRFNGGFRYTFNLNDQQLLGFKDIIRKYQSLK
ncbi:MAG: coiled-coil domain-containing protein [Syntrophales bacterium]